jgi:hypothetical protein
MLQNAWRFCLTILRRIVKLTLTSVVAGLVPATPIRKALCPPKRDRRDKPGDDGGE